MQILYKPVSSHAISIESISKSYLIGLRKQRQDTLRDSLVEAIRKPFRPGKSHSDNMIWALRDVSFDINRGEAIGIIGRNGAGKSTLLKILSQITEPTEGRVIINGRIGSLLEVGTGFHWELTGRENIYLNGAVLGMTRKEIQSKFDEIVEFSGVEKFLDTPVKRYSSGMFVRLGFSVAAHLDPEILIVDEVLSVGDTEFQKKCLGVMDDVASHGRTVLFVSHNMNVIQRLCTRAVLLDNGEVKKVGKTSDVIKTYMGDSLDVNHPEQWISLMNSSFEGRGETGAFFKEIWFSSRNTDFNNKLYPDGPLEMRLRIQSDSSRKINSMAVIFYDQFGIKLLNADIVSSGQIIDLSPGINEIHLNIPKIHLKSGIYQVGVWLSNTPIQVFDHKEQALKVEIVDIDTETFGRRPPNDGVVTCDFTYKRFLEYPN